MRATCGKLVKIIETSPQQCTIEILESAHIKSFAYFYEKTNIDPPHEWTVLMNLSIKHFNAKTLMMVSMLTVTPAMKNEIRFVIQVSLKLS